MSTTYSQPTTIWRLRHPDGRVAHAVIVPRWSDSSAVWFIDGKPEEAKDFDNWERAVGWIDEVKTVLMQHAWSPDSDHEANT